MKTNARIIHIDVTQTHTQQHWADTHWSYWSRAWDNWVPLCFQSTPLTPTSPDGVSSVQDMFHSRSLNLPHLLETSSKIEQRRLKTELAEGSTWDQMVEEWIRVVWRSDGGGLTWGGRDREPDCGDQTNDGLEDHKAYGRRVSAWWQSDGHGQAFLLELRKYYHFGACSLSLPYSCNLNNIYVVLYLCIQYV